ncbi:MAG TPA: Na+/H+ antiporter subunit E [Gemmatimonadaceae bacterium]|nr:Na+/H+ antiporter subunit E [Gemmatimonadaceae bacterium]
MSMFLWNILLAILWAAVSGTFTPFDLVVGFIVGYVILLIAKPALGPSSYHTGIWRTIRFVLFFVRELFVSSIRVAHDVLTPTHYMKPGVIGIPLDVQSDIEITLLANLVSLTPGSLTLDVSTDRSTLYVHVMYLDGEVDDMRLAIKRGLERRVINLLRGKGEGDRG